MVCRGSERVEVIDIDGSEVLLNLSATGVALLHSAPLEKNSSVVVTINDVQVKGQVIYCNRPIDNYRIGVRFNAVTSEEKSAVGRMVDSFSCGVPLRFSFEIAALK